MFTGIIEELGIIKKIIPKSSGMRCEIIAKQIGDELRISDSVAVNGVCLTVVDRIKNTFIIDIVNETLEKSNLGDLKEGDYKNLERALKASGRFGGHIVQGHIETVGVILDKQIDNDDTTLSVGLDPEWMRFCIPKGSIALDGISLTIAKIESNVIEVALIPHTLDNTTLGLKHKSDTLNIETDIIGKYIERLISFEEEDPQIDLGLLKGIRNLQYGES